VQLRCVYAYPDTIDLSLGIPETQVAIHISRLLDVVPNNGPVNIHDSVFDVPENAVVGCRRTPQVVVLGIAVDRNSNRHAGQTAPDLRDGDHTTGYYQRVNAAATQFRYHPAQLTMTHQRLSADKRNLQGLMFLNEPENSIDQVVAAVITEATKIRATLSQMRITVSVAARTSKRTLTGHFDGKHRNFTS